jgi:hypothetical protein
VEKHLFLTIIDDQKMTSPLSNIKGQNIIPTPYGQAKLSPLTSLYRKTGLDPVKARELMAKAGIIVKDEKQTVAAIAAQNKMTPRALFDIIKPASTEVATAVRAFSDGPMPGFGNKTLQEICAASTLQPTRIIKGLARENISVRPDQTVREIAGAAKMEPSALFAILHRLAAESNGK